jgi:hypothetical protein
MEKGQKYLLFVRSFQGHFVIDNCGNSALLSEAEDAIDGIREIASASPYGEIEGRVESGGKFNTAGIRIIARSGKTAFSTRTGEDGWFELRVPPGSYRLIAKSSAFFVVPYDLNEDDPQHFVVYKGGCTHIEYDAQPK